MIKQYLQHFVAEKITENNKRIQKHNNIILYFILNYLKINKIY